jgi:hypothetical protein
MTKQMKAIICPTSVRLIFTPCSSQIVGGCAQGSPFSVGG